MQGSARGPPTPWLRLKCLPPSLFMDKNEAIKQAFKVWGCSRVEPVLNPISCTYTRQAIVQLRSAQVVRSLVNSQRMRMNPARWGVAGCSEANFAPTTAKPLCSCAVPEW